jgi:hypothetical protein
MKDGAVFWVGAAVPFGTTDFTKIQVFFHPTVRSDQCSGPGGVLLASCSR